MFFFGEDKRCSSFGRLSSKWSFMRCFILSFVDYIIRFFLDGSGLVFGKTLIIGVGLRRRRRRNIVLLIGSVSCLLLIRIIHFILIFNNCWLRL